MHQVAAQTASEVGPHHALARIGVEQRVDRLAYFLRARDQRKAALRIGRDRLAEPLAETLEAVECRVHLTAPAGQSGVTLSS